jgi:hypothetical protein
MKTGLEIFFTTEIYMLWHGQTLANRTIPGSSLQVEKWLWFCYLLIFLLSKTA